MNTIEKLINPWLQQRQQILVTLNSLARLLPYADNSPISLSKFFQLLIDYTCAGHLQIFTICLEQSIDNFVPVKQILQKINNSTDHILKFNYKFNKFKNISVNDMVTLLEQFSNRIELEDLLINMKAIHKNQIN
ncbi:MAG: Rsd/AlgQ family anti-sigma factor [Gammaproteobacteria bacterium]|jgi:regulator of sigma D